jgi:hypothetical protein
VGLKNVWYGYRVLGKNVYSSRKSTRLVFGYRNQAKRFVEEEVLKLVPVEQLINEKTMLIIENCEAFYYHMKSDKKISMRKYPKEENKPERMRKSQGRVKAPVY